MPKCIELPPCDWLISNLCYHAIERVYLVKWPVSVYVGYGQTFHFPYNVNILILQSLWSVPGAQPWYRYWGGPNVSPPQDIFFLRLVADQIVKTNRPVHQRMYRGLSMEWEVRELLGL